MDVTIHPRLAGLQDWHLDEGGWRICTGPNWRPTSTWSTRNPFDEAVRARALMALIALPIPWRWRRILVGISAGIRRRSSCPGWVSALAKRVPGALSVGASAAGPGVSPLALASLQPPRPASSTADQ